MQLLQKAKTFARMPVHVKLLFAEAALTSAYVKFTLAFLPFKKVAAWQGRPEKEARIAQQPESIQQIRDVKTAILLTDKYMPWPTECYTRSLTAKIMLRRRKVSSAMYIAFRRNEQQKVDGHAWLNASGIIVTGMCDFSKYHIHAVYN